MKTINMLLWLLSCFLCFSCSPQEKEGIAQIFNNTIVNANSSWATLGHGVCPECTVWTQYVYFDDDSIVADYSYKKLFSCNDKLHENIKFEGLIREQNKKTYFIPANSKTEYLLYDFSLEEGMTFEHRSCLSQETQLLEVKNSDMVEINGVLKKRLQITYSPSSFYDYIIDTWIDNVGSLGGILYPCLGLRLDGGISTLLCYYQNNELVYKNPAYSECYYDKKEDITSVQTITQGKIWHVESGGACLDGDETGCFCYSGIQTINVGNTKIFNGKEYYELLTDSPPNNSSQGNVLTYVREEGKKVFFYVESCNKEYLMYDFNLNVGDEVFLMDPLSPISLFDHDNPCELTEVDVNLYTFKVTEVDFIEYNYIKRKRLRLENHDSHHYDIWVEGIGCLRGITYHTAQQISGAKQLKDCFESDELIFVNENPEYCWITTKK